MSYSFKNLRTPQNLSVRGVAEYALLAPKSYFEVNGIKAPVGPFINQGDMITITTPHVFTAGMGFLYFQLAPQKNQLDSETTGDRGLQSITSGIDIFVPGSYKEVHEQMQNLINVPCIAMQKDASCPDNLIYQLGCDCNFAWLNWKFTTGTTKDGVKGFAVKVDYDGAIQFYNVAGGPELMAD
jgi:hypothetical protein